jgi:acetyltransferase-like isoleucine patch superfamily enzyme
MRKTIAKLFRILYIWISIIRFLARKWIFGLDHAGKIFLTLHPLAVVPLLRFGGACISKKCKIESPLIIHFAINDYSNLVIEENCSISKNCFLDLRDKIIIKRNSTIAMNVVFITHMHLGRSPLISFYPNKIKYIYIGEGCYIGASSTLYQCQIADYNLVAAMSFVNKDFKNSYKLIGGIPAVELKNIS